jgi:hypothetical protein
MGGTGILRTQISFRYFAEYKFSVFDTVHAVKERERLN